MAFDPKKYLEKTSSQGFDPAAYLAKSGAPEEVRPSDGAGQAFLESYGNSALLGYLPQVQALAGKLMPDPSGELDEKLRKQGFQIQQQKGTYIAERDKNLARQKKQGEEHPYASGAGTLTGLAAGFLVPAGAMAKAGQSMTYAQKVKAGAKLGALYGAAANPGDTEGEFSPLQVGDRLKGAAIGAATGGVLAGAIDDAMVLSKAAREKLREKAAKRATRALGRPTPTVTNNMKASGQDVELGRELLDAGAIPVFGTPERIGRRVDKLADQAGEEIGQIVGRVQNRRAEFTPITIRDKKAGAAPFSPVKFVKHPKGKVVQEEVLVTPVRFDENPARRLGVNLRPEDAPPRIVRGEVQPVQKELRLQPGTEVVRPNQTKLGKARPHQKEVIAGKEQTLPVRGTTIDTKQIADDIRQGGDFRALKQNELAGESERIGTMLDKLAEKGELTMREAQSLRQHVDSRISFSKRVPDMAELQQYLYKIRSGIRNSMNKAAESAGTEKNALLNANRRYHNATTAQDILEREMGRNQTNHDFGLIDLATANLGSQPWHQVALALASKGARTFGNSMAARGFDGTAKALAHVPGAARALESRAFALQNAGLKAKQSGGERFQEEEKYPMLQDQQLMRHFQENPELIDRLQDDKLRAQIKKAISRNPAAQPEKLKPGTIRDGKMFTGGDASDSRSWQPLKKGQGVK
jgi:hypothetical protein